MSKVVLANIIIVYQYGLGLVMNNRDWKGSGHILYKGQLYSLHIQAGLLGPSWSTPFYLLYTHRRETVRAGRGVWLFPPLQMVELSPDKWHDCGHSGPEPGLRPWIFSTHRVAKILKEREGFKKIILFLNAFAYYLFICFKNKGEERRRQVP